MSLSIIDKELLSYVTQLNEQQKKSLLELIRTFLKGNTESKETGSLRQYNQELNEAMERVANGEFTTLEELEKEMQSW